MNAQMMQMPLQISSLLTHAARHHGDTEIVSKRVEGDIHRTTYHQLEQRARQLASAFAKAGLEEGERVATLAWNGYRHMELYFGVSGQNRVIHTINPRLHVEQIIWMVNDAADQFLAFDMSFLPIIQAIQPHCPTIKGWIALCDSDAQPTETGIETLLNYEDFLLSGDERTDWQSYDENSAIGLCYTSGTTGNPKGALYSHRSTVLHAFAAALPDAMALSARDTVLPVVPMFHANAWGIPYSAPLVGAKLVFPGPNLDGKSIYELFESEHVTYSAGVPTVWLALLQHIESNALAFNSLTRTVIGGSACPPSMISAFEKLGVDVIHAWGMTEMSPLGTACTLQSRHRDIDDQTRMEILGKQGRCIYGVDMKIVDDAGHELPWDGVTFGNLLVSGPWVIETYFNHQNEKILQLDEKGKGWFCTGDVATIDPHGYLHITDRSKDVIKSGGEWISSIQLENTAIGHPAVASAAVIGIVHPKWDERPLLIVKLQPDSNLTRDELLDYFKGKVAKYCIPDDVQFVDDIPLGATGKILKTQLREQFKDYTFG